MAKKKKELASISSFPERQKEIVSFSKINVYAL